MDFTAGYADAASVPPPAATAIKLLASHWWKSRVAYGEVNLSDIPKGWAAICAMYDTGVRGDWNV